MPYSQVKQIVTTMGSFNCMIYTVYKDPKDMRDFLLGTLGKMPGIKSYETLTGLDIRKDSTMLVSEHRSRTAVGPTMSSRATK